MRYHADEPAKSYQRVCHRCDSIYYSSARSSMYCDKCQVVGNNHFMGYKVCPEWLRKLYRKSVKFICQDCKHHEDEVGNLQPHRITRGNKGGLYTVVPLRSIRNNIKVVCDKCHKVYHRKENGCTSK
jgi:hypothetical protein